jgi:hypothetical protein
MNSRILSIKALEFHFSESLHYKNATIHAPPVMDLIKIIVHHVTIMIIEIQLITAYVSAKQNIMMMEQIKYAKNAISLVRLARVKEIKELNDLKFKIKYN